MAKRSAIDELDDAVHALMAEPHAPSPRMNPRLAGLLRIAADLHDLPSGAFKARLRAELRSEVREGGAPPSAGRPLVTEEDIRARLEELADEPGMDVLLRHQRSSGAGGDRKSTRLNSSH